MRRKPAMLSAAMRATRLYSSECSAEYEKCTTQSWDNCVRRPNLKSFFNVGDATPPAMLAEVRGVAGSGAAAASTGGKTRLGGISKRGNGYLRRLLINGASANLLRSKATSADPWVIGLRRRRPSLVVAVALANKTARIAWAVMHREKSYRHRSAAA